MAGSRRGRSRRPVGVGLGRTPPTPRPWRRRAFTAISASVRASVALVDLQVGPLGADDQVNDDHDRRRIRDAGPTRNRWSSTSAATVEIGAGFDAAGVADVLRRTRDHLDPRQRLDLRRSGSISSAAVWLASVARSRVIPWQVLHRR